MVSGLATETEAKALRSWLTVLAVYEGVAVANLYRSKAPLSGFYAALRKSGATGKRAFAFILLLLAASRLQGALYPLTRGCLAQIALVHVLEAAFFGIEVARRPSSGSVAKYSIILFNAVWFLSAFLRAN